MKILIADDEDTDRLLLQAALERMGHSVVATSDGAEAWERFREDSYAVLVLDWMMPHYDGPTVCRMVRALARESYTFITLLTAKKGKPHYLEGMKAGADDFISKPIDFDELEARMNVAERILGLQGRIRQLEGLLSICSYCKKIRDDAGQWIAVEQYLVNRTDLTFTHGICSICSSRLLRGA